VLDDLSQEELLAFELAEADMSLDEDEDEAEEWRHYDEEVNQIQELLDTTGASLDSNHASNGTSSLSSNGSLGIEASSAKMAELDAASLEKLSALTVLLEESSLERGPPDRPSTAEEMLMALTAAIREPGLAAPGASRGFALPTEYRRRLAEHKGGVVVSNTLGSMTVVLLSHVPNQPELLPVLSRTFRAQRVRILRGWLETTGGVAMDVFEVCEDATGEALSEDRAGSLEGALEQAVRAPAVRQVLVELDGQFPRLDALCGLPASASRCPPMPAARGALVGGPFSVLEGWDLGRALIFRVKLEHGIPADKALDESRCRLCRISPEYKGELECLMLGGISGPLLAVLPVKELEQALQPTFDHWLVFLLCVGIAAIYSKGAVAAASGGASSMALFLFGVLGTSELVRRAAAHSYGVRLSPPFFFPSPAIGTFGAASRALSVVPGAAALFDMAAAALAATLLASAALIAGSFALPPEPESCAWVNPNLFPAILKWLVHSRAESLQGFCIQPPDGSGLVAAPEALVAGSFATLAAALNALPLGNFETDGMAILAAVPWRGVRDSLLPWAALALLTFTFVGGESDSLVPIVVAFFIFTCGVRPQLVAEPVLRDSVTPPCDIPRQIVSVFLTSIAFAVLIPTSVLDLLSMMASSFPVAS